MVHVNLNNPGAAIHGGADVADHIIIETGILDTRRILLD